MRRETNPREGVVVREEGVECQLLSGIGTRRALWAV
jgi:hypothetical protein